MARPRYELRPTDSSRSGNPTRPPSPSPKRGGPLATLRVFGADKDERGDTGEGPDRVSRVTETTNDPSWSLESLGLGEFSQVQVLVLKGGEPGVAYRGPVSIDVSNPSSLDETTSHLCLFNNYKLESPLIKSRRVLE